MSRSKPRITAATARNSVLNPIADENSASATNDIDRKVRNIPARVNASLYASDRAVSRLQCSVLRIWTARGSSSEATGSTGVAAGGRSAGMIPPSGRKAVPCADYPAPHSGRSGPGPGWRHDDPPLDPSDGQRGDTDEQPHLERRHPRNAATDRRGPEVDQPALPVAALDARDDAVGDHRSPGSRARPRHRPGGRAPRPGLPIAPRGTR